MKDEVPGSNVGARRAAQSFGTMKLFRTITTLLMICLALSAVVHAVLLSWDSAEYRTSDLVGARQLSLEQ
ncbi:MAG TPA: hypothetical protein VKB34_08990 [Povalibacter sp.]|nr:hypothetical protein [Povalibacter sp.]